MESFQSMRKQKFWTKSIETAAAKYPIYSQDGKGMDSKVLVKYFNPYGAGTWIITEAERDGDDILLYGYCNIHEWEWGYVSLKELESIMVNVWGCRLPLERDITVEPLKYTVRELI